ncbi:MAG: hypothetical protein JSS47_23655, partial [Proteobacteria bacterium]|nr:hypothetical protein [Pseudomonadota bacterium]
MDNGHPPAWLDALRERLLPELQAHGLHIDARTWLNLGAWLNAAQERGLLGADPSSAQGAVRAIVSKSAREQQVFDQVFDAWRLRWDEGCELLGTPASASEEASPAVARPRADPHAGLHRWATRQRVLAAVLVAIALPLAIPYVRDRLATLGSPSASVPAPSRPVPGAAAPTGAQVELPRAADKAGQTEIQLQAPPWLFGIHPAWYAAAVALLGAPAMFVRRTRRAQLARVSTRENLREQEVFARQLVPVSGERRAALRTAVRGLRRPRTAAGRTLDVIASACATAARAGLFSPVHRPRLARPEYLFLVDRAGPGDQQAHWAAEMARDLAAEGVGLTLYEFDRDPRWVAPLRLHRSLSAGPPQHFVPLARLAARHAGQGLIVFADGYGFIDPASASLHSWLAEALAPWPCRVLMTPVPLASWGAAEDVLAGAGQPTQAPSFLLLPGQIDALSAAVRWFVAGELPEVAALPGAPAVLPPLLRDDPVRWLGADPPDAGELKALLEQLRAYLGVTPYTWLAASAAYPQMSADLTAYLAQADAFADVALPAEAGSARARPDVRLLEARLLAIAQLPWCRHGHMPDWLRRALFLSLPPGVREQVRILFARLFDAAGADDAAGALSLGVVASAAEPSRGAWLARLRRRIRLAGVVEDEPADSPLRDVIYLGVLRGDFDAELTLDAPEAFARAACADSGLRLSRNPLRWVAAAVLTAGFALLWLRWWLESLRLRLATRRLATRAERRPRGEDGGQPGAEAEADVDSEPPGQTTTTADGGMVYLSYSRSEAEAPAQALRERLVAKFGMNSVWDGRI